MMLKEDLEQLKRVMESTKDSCAWSVSSAKEFAEKYPTDSNKATLTRCQKIERALAEAEESLEEIDGWGEIETY